MTREKYISRIFSIILHFKLPSPESEQSIVEHLLACQLTNLPNQTYCDETSVDYTEKIAKLILKKMTSTGGAATAAGGGVIIKRASKRLP
jgi:hypothetical protein